MAFAVPTIAVGTKWMKLVISTETECPARLVCRPGPTAGVATEAAPLGAGVPGAAARSRAGQARDHLLEVLSQFRQLLGKLVQGCLAGRAVFDRRAVASTHRRSPLLAQVRTVASL